MAYTTIDDGSKYFQTAIWTGNASNRSIVNPGNSDMQPDWVWTKKRSAAQNHCVTDSSRGVANIIFPDASDNESATQLLTSFDSDGFSINTNALVNENSATYVGWQWKCNGGSTETAVNESGDNPGNVRQTNTDAGFSIITYTGTGDAGTIAHGLGAVPHWIVIKQRTDVGGVAEWVVFHKRLGGTHYVKMSTTASQIDSSGLWEDTDPTSSVFTVHSSHQANADGGNFVAYVFTEKQGYSKFGSYIGSGNDNGPFIYTGFKPAWLMIKRIDGGSNAWGIYDSVRGAFNEITMNLDADRNDAENTATNYDDLDFLSNGFKLYELNDDINASDTYVYMAFAEHPFVSSKGVPTTAR